MPRFSSRVLLLVVCGRLATAPSFAQGFPLSGQSATAPASPSLPAPDSLGRDNPHGAVVGFLRAAQDEEYAIATQYFEPAAPHHRLTPDQEEELAEELLSILNQKFGTILDSISHEPQGRLDDGLAPDLEQVAPA